jgi:hypothetical protein
MEEHPVYLPAPPDKRRAFARMLAMVVFALLILSTGYLALQLLQCKNQDKKTAAANAQLEQKVVKLTRDLAAVKGEAPAKTNAATGEKVCTSTAVTQTLKDNIAAAVTSKNYAALQGYMAAQVNVVIAASEKGGNEAPAKAVDDMAYLDNGIPPWDFALPSSTTDIWAAHFYKDYFIGTFFAGKSSTDNVVSFQFDSCGKIKTVFMAADAGILEQS